MPINVVYCKLCRKAIAAGEGVAGISHRHPDGSVTKDVVTMKDVDESNICDVLGSAGVQIQMKDQKTIVKTVEDWLRYLDRYVPEG
jgi:hypothetical protein